MSYNGVGSYYEFSPHQVYSGYGADMHSAYDVYASYGGFGSIRETFDAETVMQEANLGGAVGGFMNAKSKLNCNDPQQKQACAAFDMQIAAANAAGYRATAAIQKGLVEMGYDPGPVDGKWGTNTQKAWDKYKQDKNLPAGPAPYGINLTALKAMETDLKGGASPGKSMLSAGLPLLLIAGAALGGLYLLRKRRSRPRSTAMVPYRANAYKKKTSPRRRRPIKRSTKSEFIARQMRKGRSRKQAEALYKMLYLYKK